MFWTIIERIGLLLGTTLAGKQLMELFDDIKTHSIYSPEEVATLLQMEKADVIDMIHTGKIKALKNNGQYRILGKNIIRALSPLSNENTDLEFYANQARIKQRQN